MAVIYEATVHYSAQGQELNNVLYYCENTALQQPFSSTDALSLATEVRDLAITNIMPALPSTTSLTGVSVRGLNELRQVISTFTQTVAANSPGSVVGSSDTPGIVQIIGFQLLAGTVPGFPRVPRRSYVALGPMVSNFLNDDGFSTLPAGNRTNIALFLTTAHLINAISYVPCRLGVPNDLGQAALGIVVGTIFRNYMSFRRSRLIPTTG